MPGVPDESGRDAFLGPVLAEMEQDLLAQRQGRFLLGGVFGRRQVHRQAGFRPWIPLLGVPRQHALHLLPAGLPWSIWQLARKEIVPSQVGGGACLLLSRTIEQLREQFPGMWIRFACLVDVVILVLGFRE